QSAAPPASAELPAHVSSPSPSAAPSVEASTSSSANAKGAKELGPVHKAAAALAVGDTRQALAELDESAQPGGADERRLRRRVRIEILLRDGRTNEARAALELFARDFPDDAKLPSLRA